VRTKFDIYVFFFIDYVKVLFDTIYRLLFDTIYRLLFEKKNVNIKLCAHVAFLE
jgi:hypothetical protein